MTEPREFTSSVRRDEPLTFKLDGVEYGFRPPKAAVQMMPIYTGATDVDYMEARFNWLEKGLNAHDWSLLDETARRAVHGIEDPAAPVPANPPESWRGTQATGLEARLRDDYDNFDVPDLERILDGLTKDVAGRPTT
jgi:hypothetical protein